MNRRKLVFSIALGTLLTLGVLVGFSLNGDAALASAVAPEVVEQVDSGEAIRAQGAVSTAHVVVQFSDGDTAVRPITWTGSITRIAALKVAGFAVEHNAETVCSIDGDGCPSGTSCFTCGDNLWGQGEWAGTAWAETYSPPNLLTDGDVIAFRNGTQPDYSDWGLTGFLPGAPTYVAASDALEWMRDQQQEDGSYPGLSIIGGSVRTLIALGSAGYDPDEWGDPSLLEFLTVTSDTATVNYAATGAAEAGKLTVGAAWTDQPVTDFIDINLPMSITAYYSATTGGYGTNSTDTAWAALGLHAAGEDIPSTTIDFLVSLQNVDGGWNWADDPDSPSEVQQTALCVQALLAAGESVTATEVVSALTFIDSAKKSDGGYGYLVGDSSGVNTTAYVLQSLMSAGQIPTGNWCSKVRCGYLSSNQADEGYFSFGGNPSLYATQEAIPALMHRPFGPLAPWTYNCYVNYLPMITKDFSSGS
jgi:hypothetical protein